MFRGLGPAPKSSAILSRKPSGSAALPLSDRCSAGNNSVLTVSDKTASASPLTELMASVEITDRSNNLPILWLLCLMSMGSLSLIWGNAGLARVYFSTISLSVEVVTICKALDREAVCPSRASV